MDTFARDGKPAFRTLVTPCARTNPIVCSSRQLLDVFTPSTNSYDTKLCRAALDEADLQVLTACMADRKPRGNSKEKEMPIHSTETFRAGLCTIYETCRVSDANEKEQSKTRKRKRLQLANTFKEFGFVLCGASEGVAWVWVWAIWGGGEAGGGAHAYKYKGKWGNTYDSRYSELRCVGSRDSQIKTDRRPKFARKKNAICLTKGPMQPLKIATKKGQPCTAEPLGFEFPISC